MEEMRRKRLAEEKRTGGVNFSWYFPRGDGAVFGESMNSGYMLVHCSAQGAGK